MGTAENCDTAVIVNTNLLQEVLNLEKSLFFVLRKISHRPQMFYLNWNMNSFFASIFPPQNIKVRFPDHFHYL
jgi:hypothetical protein